MPVCVNIKPDGLLSSYVFLECEDRKGVLIHAFCSVLVDVVPNVSVEPSIVDFGVIDRNNIEKRTIRRAAVF